VDGQEEEEGQASPPLADGGAFEDALEFDGLEGLAPGSQPISSGHRAHPPGSVPLVAIRTATNPDKGAGGEGEEGPLPARPSLVVGETDKFGRLLLHAMCRYYGLESSSQDTPQGRVTRVLRSGSSGPSSPALVSGRAEAPPSRPRIPFIAYLFVGEGKGSPSSTSPLPTTG
jgi:hypothetical protein